MRYKNPQKMKAFVRKEIHNLFCWAGPGITNNRFVQVSTEGVMVASSGAGDGSELLNGGSELPRGGLARASDAGRSCSCSDNSDAVELVSPPPLRSIIRSLVS